MRSVIVLVMKLLKSPLIRYLAVGVSAYIFEMLTLYTLKHSGFDSVHAVAISFWAGLIVAFVLQKFIAFKDRRRHHKVILKQASIYLALVFVNYSFTLITVHSFKSIADVYVIRTVVIAITTVWNFAVYRIIFKNNVSEPSYETSENI